MAAAHSAAAAARWQQHGGCSGFTGTVCECANACAFECHRRAAVLYKSLSLVEDGGTTAPTASSSLAATAAPVATSTAVADAPTLLLTTQTATPMTLFVKLNLIYYYYLFICHEKAAMAAKRLQRRRRREGSIGATAAATAAQRRRHDGATAAARAGTGGGMMFVADNYQYLSKRTNKNRQLGQF